MTRLLESFRKLFRRPPLLYVAHDSGGWHKPTILLIHGIATDANYWKPLLAELDGEKYRLVAVDLLGCGKSPRPKNCQYRTEDFVKALHRTVKKMKLKTPYLIAGHSMGSNIVARYVVNYPSEVWVEYLLSMPFYPKKQASDPPASDRQTDMYKKAYEFLLKNKLFTITAAQSIRKILNIEEGIDINAEDWETFSLSLKNTVIKQNTFTDIKRTKYIPIHLIYGNLDEFLVRDNFKKLESFQNIIISKLFAIDHHLGHRYAKFVAGQMEADYNDYLGV